MSDTLDVGLAHFVTILLISLPVRSGLEIRAP